MIKRIICLILCISMCLPSVAMAAGTQNAISINDTVNEVNIEAELTESFKPSQVTMNTEATRQDIIRYTRIAPEDYEEAEKVLEILEKFSYSAPEKADILKLKMSDANLTVQECIDRYNSFEDKAEYRRDTEKYLLFIKAFENEEETESELFSENISSSEEVSLIEKSGLFNNAKPEKLDISDDAAVAQRREIMTGNIAKQKAKDMFLQGYSAEEIEKAFYTSAVTGIEPEEIVGQQALFADGGSAAQALSREFEVESIEELELIGAQVMAASNIVGSNGEQKAPENPLIVDFSSDDSVNMLTGGVNYNYNMFSIPGRNGLNVELVLKYDFDDALLGKTTEYTYSIEESRSEKIRYNADTVSSLYFNIGAGWRFDIPYILDSRIYIPKKGSYSYTKDDNSIYDVDSYSRYDVTAYKPGENTIPQELKSDENFVPNMAVPVLGGTTYYFLEETVSWDDEEGNDEDTYNGRIVGIKDRYGNLIQYKYADVDFGTYTKSLLSKIIDTNGKEISFTYTNTETDLYELTITSPDNKVFKISFSRSHIPGEMYEDFREISAHTYLYALNSVENPNGEVTEFEYYQPSDETYYENYHYIFYSRLLNEDDSIAWEGAIDKYYNIPRIMLSEVIYPTGARVEYEYRKIAKNIAYIDNAKYDKFYTVKRRAFYDGLTNTAPVNESSFDFVIENDFYGERSRLTQNNDVDIYYLFDVNGLCINEKVINPQEKKIKEITTEYGENQKILEQYVDVYDPETLLTYSTAEIYNYTIFGTVEWEYSIFADGNAAGGLCRTDYTYDSTGYPVVVPVEKRIQTNEDTEVKVVNLLNDKKEIIKTEIVEVTNILSLLPKSTVKSRTEYAYDEYGNVIETKAYPDISDTSKYIKTQTTYNSGTLPSTVSVYDYVNGNGSSGVSESYTYDTMWRPLTHTDRKGNTTSYEYDDIGRNTKITYPDGSTDIYAFNTAENTTTHTDRGDNSYVYDYSPLGMLMTVTDPASTVTQTNTYDNRGRVVETLNASGESSTGKVKYLYDILDRVTDKKVYDDDGVTLLNHESYEYIDCAQFTEGETTSYYGYAEVKKTYNDDDTVKETYTSIYDKFSRLRAEKVGDTTLKTYEYNHLNQLISEQGDGLNLAYTYGWHGEPETITRTIGENTYTEKNIYNSLGQLTAYRDYDGYAGDYDTVIYEYDYLGNVKKQKNAFDVTDDTVIYAETVNTYDANGNVTKTEIKNSAPGAEASHVETNYTYDNLNRPVTATSGNIVTTYTYDDLGNIATQKTGDSQTEYSYNTLGQLIKKTDALEQDEVYTYDKNGFLKTKTDRNGTVFTYTYDALGNVLSENAIGTDLSTNTRTSTYSKTGELKSVTENGKTLNYEYDSKGLLTKVTDATAGTVQNYTYDNYGKLTNYTLSLDDVQQINTAYTYDDAARMHTVSENGTIQATYTYNPDNTIQSETIGNGITTAYTYNTANLVTNVSSTKNNALLAGYSYGYLLDGNITSKSDNTGITTNYVYNNAGMLTSETVSSLSEELQNTAYSYDNRGNRTGVISTGYDEYTETYTYDLNNRLTKLEKLVYNEYDHPDNIFSTRYNYDSNGNLFSENTSAISKSLDSPALNVSVFGSGNVGWDSKTGLTFYNYNVNNQLESVVKDGKTATYTYNPDGYRSSKTVDSITTNHIWNGTQIVLETDSTDAVIAEYIYGTKRIYNEQNNEKTYYLYDAHGDTKQLTNATGSITWDYTYDAFGNELDLSNDIVDTTTTITEPYNPFRYCGEYYDTETGFIYLRARYYSPEIGRFVSEDPVSDGINWYAYCCNNPTAFVDIFGLEPSPLEAALMAQYAYTLYDAKMAVDNFEIVYYANKPLGDDFGGWMLQETLPTSEGLFMCVFYREVDGVTEYAVVNKGTSNWFTTDNKLSAEGWNNILQPVGLSENVKSSIKMAQNFVNGEYGNHEITFIGHSKGGAEAIANAVATGRPCITFNPANPNLRSYGLLLHELQYDDYNMTHYIVDGEILNSIKGFLGEPSVGNITRLPLQEMKSYETQLGSLSIKAETSDFIGNHGMKSVINALKSIKEA